MTTKTIRVLKGISEDNDFGRKPHTFEGDVWTRSKVDGHTFALRPGHARHYREIDSGWKLRASLRAGQYAWPGGYEIAYYTNDGATLCAPCVQDNLRNILDSMRSHNDDIGYDDGWCVVGCDAVQCADEADERCDHCNNPF